MTLPIRSKSSLPSESDEWSESSSDAMDSGFPSSLLVFASVLFPVPVITEEVGFDFDFLLTPNSFSDSGFLIPPLQLRSLDDVAGSDSEEEEVF